MTRFVRAESALPPRTAGLGQGWADLLCALNRRLRAQDPPALAALDRLGGVVLYDPSRRDATREMCDALEGELSATCEQCGGPGSFRATYVTLVLCDRCALQGAQ